MSADGVPAASTAQPLQRLRADLAARGGAGWPRGAVGAHAGDGSALYAYPEVAGYWLQWASARVDVENTHGAAVLAWLADAGRGDGAWPARIGAAGAEYAATIYLYDHALLWHGLRCWALRRADALAAALADSAWSALARFNVDGGWRAAIGAPSARWSGQGGPFLLKALARVRAGEGALAEAARRALPECVEAALAKPHAEAHPQLYAIEGLLLLGEQAAARTAFDALLGAHGGLAALRERAGAGPRRFDVLAQALRVAAWLGIAKGSTREREAMRLREELARAIDTRGRMPFAPGADHCPTWTALFAEQALALLGGEAIASEDLV